MSKPWSKLQKEYYLLIADGLKIKLHCRAYRMDSQRGGTKLPRYWITLNKKTIWDYPKQFIGEEHPSRANSQWYPYSTDVSDISNLIREYIDTPKYELLTRNFKDDHWGLTDILKASDKRIGKRRLPDLKVIITNKAALKVVEARMMETNIDDKKLCQKKSPHS